MPLPRIFRDKVSEAGTWYHRARLVDKDNNVLVQGDFTGSCLVQVFDLAGTNVDAAIYSNVRTVAAVVTNTLQDWDADTIGFNLEIANASNNFTREGDHTYRVCAYLTHSSQGLMPTVWEVKPETLFGV